MQIFTIGFTQKSAEEFFTRLNQPGLLRVVDTRLNNTSQLSGFAKKKDLIFFLKEIGNLDYIHVPELAPTLEILEPYRNGITPWAIYADQYLDLIARRQIENTLSKDVIAGGCFLCSESKPHFCHRRLAAEYLRDKWGEVDILHL